MEQEEYKKSLLEYEGIRDAIECAREDAAKENFEQGLKQGEKKDEKRCCFRWQGKCLNWVFLLRMLPEKRELTENN